MKISISTLHSLMIKILSSKYYSESEAELMSEVFMYAELSGKNTQGVLKLIGTEGAQNIKPKHAPKIESKTKLSALIDGGGAAGPLVAQLATNKVIQLASEHSFGIVGTNNTFSSVGAIGYYARKMAQNNLIGIVMASCPKGVLHFGGIDQVYGTNPVAYGFPTLSHPIVFDMATSAITWYGLVRAQALGQPIPEQVAIDKQGNPTTDPEQAMQGAILPFDQSFKGSGLGMVVELMAGPLVGASYSHDDGDWGTVFIALCPDLLVGTDQFKKHASDLVSKIKQSRTKPGHTIHIPGFDSEEKRAAILKQGEIEIEDTIFQTLERQV